VVAPNAWELDRLTGYPATDPAAAAAAGRALARPTLVSSVAAGAADIGVVYVDGETAWLARHARAVVVPRGTGDLLTVAFTAARVGGIVGAEALELAVGVVAAAVALAAGAVELPLEALPFELRASPRVTLERVGG
jgi:pyridoxine kinase